MPILAWIVIAALCAGLGAGIVHTYNGAIARAETAEADLDVERTNVKIAEDAVADQTAENARLVGRQEALDDARKERRAAGVTAAQIEGLIDAKLNKLVATSPEVRKWATTAVPDAVLDLVREPRTKPIDRPGNNPPGAGTPAVRLDGSNAGADVAGAGRVDDKRRAFQLGPNSTGRGPILQH